MKKKMAQVITLSEYGGAGKVLIMLVNNLPLDDYDITIISGNGKEFLNWLDEDKRKKIRHIQIPSIVRSISPWNDLKTLFCLHKIFKREKYDVVHCHSSKAGILGRLAAWTAGIKRRIFTVHGWGINDYQKWYVKYFYVLLEKFAGCCSTDIVCVSNNDKKIAYKYGIASEEKLKVIYNGIENENFIKTGKLRQEINVSENDKLIGMVTRFSLQKSPLLFIKTAQYLIKERNDIKFVLIGDGPDYNECLQYVSAYNLTNSIFLLGNRLNINELLPDLDIFVLLSKWEGLPLSIIEAMFCELPVIASDVGGNAELIEDGVNGYIVNNDIAYIASKLNVVLDDDVKRIEMGKKNIQKANLMFRVKNMVKNYMELYS